MRKNYTIAKELKEAERFTKNAKRILLTGFEYARKYNIGEYKGIHLFLSLLKEKSGIVIELLNKVGVDMPKTENRIQSSLEAMSKESKFGQEFEPKLGNEIKGIIKEAFAVSAELGHVYVGTEHLLLGMFKVKNLDFVEEMRRLGINFLALKKLLNSFVNYPFPSLEEVEVPFFVDKKSEESEPEESNSLPYFCRNMNEIAKKGGYSTITGRDKEISRLIHILARKTKNNPILVGDAGVGKTAIVEGFVNALVNKKVPGSFLNKKVVSLDIGLIMSGARLRGDVEERVTTVINDAIEEGNVILFIDEIHTIVGAGSAGSKDSMDIANILKPYLTKSELSVIGATTLEEYSKYFETDSALTRRFQPITVEELDIESSKKVILGIVPEFESYHKVKILPEAVDTAVTYSARFIKDRFLPDKAIDLLDEASSSIKVGREIAMEPELNQLGSKLLLVQEKKQKALKISDYKVASKYKKEEEFLIKEIQDVIEGRKKIKQKFVKTVTSELVKNIIVEWTKIPIAASDITDKKLKDLPVRLKKRVIGQDKVIDSVSAAIQRSHLGLSGENRPLASFLFLGPTGVGKTELAKALSIELFGTEKLMQQINMSEYMEPHSVAKLIGAPPGYVGYQEGGLLTTFVKRKPYSVILFDEIEKAHPDTLNILLQILEEGELVDGRGQKSSLKNCIIIMTSNIGASEISQDSKLGFDVQQEDFQDDDVDMAYEEMRNKILDQLKTMVKPELLNRIDLIDIFRGLNKKDCLAITRKLVNELILRLMSRGIVLEVEKKVIEYINEQGYSKEYGGRNIRRKVQEIIENGLAEYLLNSEIKKKKNSITKVFVSLKENTVTFSM